MSNRSNKHCTSSHMLSILYVCEFKRTHFNIRIDEYELKHNWTDNWPHLLYRVDPTEGPCPELPDCVYMHFSVSNYTRAFKCSDFGRTMVKTASVFFKNQSLDFVLLISPGKIGPNREKNGGSVTTSRLCLEKLWATASFQCYSTDADVKTKQHLS